MPKKIDPRTAPRIAHYFRDVDLRGKSRPEYEPEAFPFHCRPDDDEWSAAFLIRVAVRFQHLWATYGVREGERTIQGPQPAVCFSSFSLADLIAVRDGFLPLDKAASQFAITIPVKLAEKGGIEPLAHSSHEDTGHLTGAPLQPNIATCAQDQRQCPGAVCGLPSWSQGQPEWRWLYSGDYGRRIDRLKSHGIEGGSIPGLKITWKKWAGIGVVVPDMATARALQYDLISLIDQGVVSKEHFDHVLVCDKLPPDFEGFDEDKWQTAFHKACFDFKSCMTVSRLVADIYRIDFESRVLILEASIPKGLVSEYGGCWLWFKDNTHWYVRALISEGRVKVNQRGRYLASLDELDPRRDLRERQDIALKLSQELQDKFGLRSSYFSVLNSQSPDDMPTYSGESWGGGYYITGTPEDEEE
jgi:hypothetical protein